jgi:hypothetical protein
MARQQHACLVARVVLRDRQPEVGGGRLDAEVGRARIVNVDGESLSETMSELG